MFSTQFDCQKDHNRGIAVTGPSNLVRLARSSGWWIRNVAWWILRCFLRMIVILANESWDVALQDEERSVTKYFLMSCHLWIDVYMTPINYNLQSNLNLNHAPAWKEVVLNTSIISTVVSTTRPSKLSRDSNHLYNLMVEMIAIELSSTTSGSICQQRQLSYNCTIRITTTKLSCTTTWTQFPQLKLLLTIRLPISRGSILVLDN